MERTGTLQPYSWLLVIKSGKNLRERGHMDDLGVDGKIILELIFKKQNGDVD
jgi:hypothetical protein